MKIYKIILCVVLVFVFSGCIFLLGNYKSQDSAVHDLPVTDAGHPVSEAPAQEIPEYNFTPEAYNARLLQIVDEYRRRNNLEPWAVDDGLSQAAQTRASECAILESKSHNRPDGSGWYTVLGIQDESDNYNYCELTGISDQSPESLLRTWVANDSINQTGLLNAEYSICGIGCEAVGNNIYCVLIIYKQ